MRNAAFAFEAKSATEASGKLELRLKKMEALEKELAEKIEALHNRIIQLNQYGGTKFERIEMEIWGKAFKDSVEKKVEPASKGAK